MSGPTRPCETAVQPLSRSDPANDCAYPRRCAVGPRRVVSGYALNDGADGERRFGVRYRDGRYHQRGLGFLGFGERIVTDLDTLAGAADFYDNISFDEDLKAFPLAGQVAKQWRWTPGLPSQPKPEQIELSFLAITRAVVPTNEEKTYFTLPTQGRLRRFEGVYAPGSSATSLLAYVRKVESSGGAKVLRDTTAKVTDFDAFGNVLTEELSTVGVDLTLQIERTFKNDLDRWVLGQLQTQKECSAAAMQSQCRLLTRSGRRMRSSTTASPTSPTSPRGFFPSSTSIAQGIRRSPSLTLGSACSPSTPTRMSS